MGRCPGRRGERARPFRPSLGARAPQREAQDRHRGRQEHDAPRPSAPACPPCTGLRFLFEVLEIGGDLFHRLVPLVGALPHRSRDDLSEAARQVGALLRQGRRLRVEDLVEHLADRLPFEGGPARGHLVEEASEREHVRPLVHGLPERLLGRHRRGCPEDLARERHARGRGGRRPLPRAGPLVQELREPEVEELRVPRRRHDDVRRLEVAMDDAAAVSVRERAREGRREAQDLLEGEALVGEVAVERLAVDELERDVVAAVRLADLEERRDVRMGEPGGGLGLAQEAPPALGVRAERRRQEFDRHFASGPAVAGEVNVSHAAGADLRDDRIRTESSARLGRPPFAHGVLMSRPFAKR